MVAVGGLYQFLDFLASGSGVGLSPVGSAVIGVVLRPEEIAVELVFPIVVNERQAHIVAPWSTIESLYDTSARQRWPVVDSHMRNSAR